MKTNEKKALQDLFNNINKVREDRMKAFTGLQSLSRDNGLPVYCSADENLKQLIRLDDIDYNEFWTVSEMALMLYSEYLTLRGKEDQLMELGEVLADAKFWGK